MPFDRTSANRIAGATRKAEDDPIRPRLQPVRTENLTPTLVRITGNLSNGYYEVDVVRHHNSGSATYIPIRVSVSTTNYVEQVYEVNGSPTLPVGVVTVAYPVFASTSGAVDSDTGGVVWVVNWGGTGQLFPVSLTSDGGSAGNATTACTFTYTVKDITGSITLATSQSPVFSRPAKGKMVAADRGTAYYDGTRTVVLYQVDEVPDVQAC